MIVPEVRSRAGSSRADFVGVELRQPSPAPENRRPSQLSDTAKLIQVWNEEFRNYKGLELVDSSDPPSLILNGTSELKNCLEIYAQGEHKKEDYALFSIMFPFQLVPVRLTVDVTLEYLKAQLFQHLKKTAVPNYPWDPNIHIFKCINKETGEMEPFYHEELQICKIPYSRCGPTLFLYPRKGTHAEKELAKQLNSVLGIPIDTLEENFSDEHKDCRSRFFQVLVENPYRQMSGLKHSNFPEEIYWPPPEERFMTEQFNRKVKMGKLHYEVYYCSREHEEAGNDKQFCFAEVDFDSQLTADMLVERALREMKQNGHSVDERDRYVLQLVGKKSYISGNKRKIINYLKIRSALENYKNPKFVLRRLDLLLPLYQLPRPLIKPHYVLVEEYRRDLDKGDIVPTWSMDEMIQIQPLSYSMFESHKDPSATVVCVFTFYVGQAVLCQYASEEASMKNPRWAKNPIYTDFYIKDIPESLSLCVQLYEVLRKEKVKKDKGTATPYEKTNDQNRGWTEFLHILNDKKEDKAMSTTCVGWYHVPMFNWQRRLIFGTYTYSLWAGEPELGKSNMCETKGDRKSTYRLTIDVQPTCSNRLKPPARVCQAVEDARWEEMHTEPEGDADIYNRDIDITNRGLKRIHDLYYLRIKQGYIDLTDEDVALLWELRYIWAKSMSDALLLLIEHRWIWMIRAHYGEIYQMLMKSVFKPLSLQTCIVILASSHGDRIVRQFATRCTDIHLHDRSMPLYILPLIQAIKTEPRIYSDLSSLVLKRSLRNWKVGHKVFWLLRAELMLLRDTVGPKNKLFNKIAILLEAYLRGNEELLPAFAKQVAMVELMNRLTTVVKSVGPRDLATKRLQEELREKCTLLENIDSPLDTSAVLGELVIDKCKVLGSAKVPLRLVWKNPLPFAAHYLTTHEIIFKNGDDLRQDLLVLQMLEIMEECWTNAGMDCALSVYPVLPTGKMMGMIGVVPNSCTIFQIQSEGGKMGTAVKSMDTTFLNKFVRNNAITTKDYIESVERFLMSCVGYSVATYIMGIKDRHNDNIMLSKDGKLFHIDFGHILGHGKKKLGIQRDRVPFILVEHFLCVISKGADKLDKDLKDILHYRRLCELAYRRLFAYRYLVIAIFTVMKQMELPELSTEGDLDHIRNTLQVFTEKEDDAAAFFDDIFEEALNGSWSTKTNWFFHTVKHL